MPGAFAIVIKVYSQSMLDYGCARLECHRPWLRTLVGSRRLIRLVYAASPLSTHH